MEQVFIVFNESPIGGGQKPFIIKLCVMGNLFLANVPVCEAVGTRLDIINYIFILPHTVGSSDNLDYPNMGHLHISKKKERQFDS